MSSRTLKSLVAVGLFGLLATPVAAQPGLSPARTLDSSLEDEDLGPRSLGMTFSASLGRGAMDISCHKCGDNDTMTEAVSFSAQLGYRFNQAWGLTGELWILEHSGNYWFSDPIWQTAWRVAGTVGPQLYIGDRFWVRGGLGVSHHWVDPGIDPDASTYDQYDLPIAGKTAPPLPVERVKETGLASSFSAGVELLADQYFSFDVQLRTGGSLTQDGWTATTAALALGVNWF